ncbi:MAG: DUF4192 domain-containing protein [Saccharothrix sp.]|nr:DUF4192 domain-containing protein [Saccharothrix sp.]
MADVHGPAALGELIATVPAMLGFRPANSLVLVVVGNDGGSAAVARLDVELLDTPVGELGADLAARLHRDLGRAELAVLLIVGDAPDAQPPHRGKVDGLVAALARNTIDVLDVVWVPMIGSGVRWESLLAATEPAGGVQPDWTSTPAAVSAIANGHRIFASRTDIDQLLQPVDAHILARRQAALREWETASAKAGMTSAAALHVVWAAVDRATRHLLPAGDDEFRALGWALAFTEVQVVMALPPADREQRHAPVTLWATLARNLPGPYRAYAACLFAVHSYLLDQRVVARTAIDHAHTSAPGHPMVRLFGELIDADAPPGEVIDQLGNEVTAAVLARIRAHGDGDAALPVIRRDGHGRCLGLEPLHLEH